ncbi:MAG TPA: carboxypeptidase-like regulatory domain-containing protein [Vicinamibacterales bacterium]
MRLRFATHAAVLSAVVVCGLAGPAGAQPVPPPPPARPVQGAPPRDPGSRMPPEAVGTGVIRGRVVASDTGNPVRRANVTLIATPPPPPPPSPPPPAGTPPGATMTATATMIMNGVTLQAGGNLLRPKSATTDSQGAFEFTALPAGTYRLTASAGQYSAAYLGIAYGAKKPSGPGSFDQGTPIQLANGQAFDKAVIALPRGAVITGRVTDENGDALARVQVYTMFYQAGSARGSRTGSGGQTDDLGQFRLFGLTPGEYAVVAEARGNTFVQPNAPPETEEDKIGFMTTYYPGSADEGGAQHVRARAGAETPGIEIRMVTGRLFHITGTVMDSQGRPATRISGNLTRRTGNMGSFSFGFATDDQGRFQMRSIPSGTYRIGVRQRPMQFNADGSNTDPGEMASVPLTVGGDVDNLMIITTAGATITGQIVFEQGAPPQMPQAMRVNASFGNPEDMAMGIGTPTAATVSPDLTFTMKGMLGEYLLRTNAPNQYLKSVTLGGEDITDAPREFKTGDRVTLTLTSRASTLEGNVTDAAGKPSTDAGLILFSEDKASWRTSSFRTRRTFVDPYGHYKLTGLMPGRYFVAAVPRDRLNTPPGADATFFEQLAKEATSVVVGEDEQRQADLKVVVMESGGN